MDAIWNPSLLQNFDTLSVKMIISVQCRNVQGCIFVQKQHSLLAHQAISGEK